MFYNYLAEQGVIDVNPIAAMPRPSVPRSMPRFLNLDDCRLLIRTARSRDDIFYRRRNTCIIILFLNIGLRLSELAGITLPDIYSDVILIKGKGNRERFVYLNKSCQRAVRLWMSHRRSESDKLFVSKQGEPLSPSSIYSVVKNLLTEAGLGDRHLSPHKLRHTCATLMYMSGTDIRLLQGVLGHASIATTEIYTHIMSEQMMDAFRNHPLAEF
jgi:site-specific recombinase XerD